MYFVSDTAVLDPTGPSEYEELASEFEAFMPGWERREAEADRERFVDPRYFAPEVDVEAVSAEDWEAFLEMSWTDPAER